MKKIFCVLFVLLCNQIAWATPYWDPQKVPRDVQSRGFNATAFDVNQLPLVQTDKGIDVLRIQVDWQPDERFMVSRMVIEESGTPTFIRHSSQKPRWGSYLGVLKDQNGEEVYFDSVGTGREYRVLTHAINLRFPVPTENMTFELYAENPQSGVMEKVVSQVLPPAQSILKQVKQTVSVRELALASQSPSVRVNIYSEGYLQNEEDDFWKHAIKTVRVLQKEKFPGVDHMSFYGVFHASKQKLGRPKNLGTPVPVYNTFLGLYYPYWSHLGRWYDGMYPTNDNKLREALASAPYDYPLILTNSAGYWGVGNYMSLTAIPAANPMQFTYLLLHEFGHFFGLNEEYSGGGQTELEFAPDMVEPWSQNITFLVDKTYENLKWKQFVNQKTPLPTSRSVWDSNPPVYGAYRGGYGDSISTKGKSHKPGLNCVMEANAHFCDICQHAIDEVVHYSLGQ